MTRTTIATIAAIVALAPIASFSAPSHVMSKKVGISAKAGATMASPSWMKIDAPSKSVHFDIKMAENANNGTLNFNGYGHGDLTITVPLNWKVSMDVVNIGQGAIPHSLEIVPVTEAIPSQGSEPPVFDGAETVELINGLGIGKSDKVEFTAGKEGHYWMFCGVPNHGIGGMYDNFVVSPTAAMPTVRISAHAAK